MTTLTLTQRPSRRMHDRLRQAIESGELQPGSQVPSIRQLAGAYKVSLPTVRSVMATLEKDGLVERRQGSGTYVCEREMDAGLTDVYLLTQTRGHLFGDMATEISSGLQAMGLRAVIGSWGGRDPAETLEQLKAQWQARQPYGVVVGWVSDALDAELTRLHGRGTRIVSFLRGRHGLPMTSPTVQISAEGSMRVAVDNLWARGHRRIGLVTHARPKVRAEFLRLHAERIVALGYEMRRRGVKKGGMTYYQMPGYTGSGRPTPRQRAADQLTKLAAWLQSPNAPTAVISEDFRLAIVLEGARMLGLQVPVDLEIVGLGNTPWAEAYGFTSVDFQPKMLVRCLLDLLGKEDAIRAGSSIDLAVQPTLIVRD